MNKRQMIFELWKLLDDIDTTSDIYKDDYKSRLEHIDKLQQQRFDVINNKRLDKLYKIFYNKKGDILTPIFNNYKGEII